MKKIRFGILSTAKIGRTKVVPAIQHSELCRVDAISSRTMESARAAADALSIPKAYDSYEALLADPDIDAVYIPLPNHLHVAWAIKGLEAGKHVLCEKPIGLNTSEANELINAEGRHPDLKIMEAFMYRHHPQWVEAKRLVDVGEIGELKTIQSFFSYYNADPDNIRNKADIGGGAMMDIGCYNISLSRFIFDAEPSRGIGFMERDPEFGTDRLFSGMLDFKGRVSSFTCSTQLADYQRVNIFGTTGRIEILIPFNAPPDRPCALILQRDNVPEDEQLRTITFDICDQYSIQADVFARAILDDTRVPVTLNDAYANMQTLERLMKSAEDGTWVRC
ncbi:Gfo/Idh/MocA family protein [Pseudodesulfovibrio portus]|uniref:Deoxyfructose oxidoreductase n=1 Tax=Pseudodesulfovibrio portus TaxID=231439 RepID=A0ABN6RUW0_9BACT|nr:Gfo/Idh/MocA family oxidoreductase [Pseudodesulfovibrio portus]BDQ34869.1 deoxyfructose oxidoreductase [Pseudodesulfovibrio portus]